MTPQDYRAGITARSAAEFAGDIGIAASVSIGTKKVVSVRGNFS